MIKEEEKQRHLSVLETAFRTQISSPWFQNWVIPALVFVLAFLPRAIRPVSQAVLWYVRSIQFSEAVLRGDLAATFLQYHPGVTVMWLSGFGLQLFARLRGLTARHLRGLEPTETGVIDDAIAAGVLPLALAIALCIVLSYLLIRRVAGRRVAFAAAGLLALDPSTSPAARSCTRTACWPRLCWLAPCFF